MPYPPEQRTAIFLNIKRRKGLAAARRFMRKHGGAKVGAYIRELRRA